MTRYHSLLARCVMYTASIILIFAVSGVPVFASTTDGTIDSTNKYAWGENVGWINFGSSEGNVHITPLAMTGYAWGENIGWISLNCSNDSSCATVNYGVANDSGSGSLSGYAWGENVGWITFDHPYGHVSINADGDFAGYAWGENVGWIAFNCADAGTCGTVSFKVSTDYQIAPSEGGGNPGGPIVPGATSVPTTSPVPSGSVVPSPSITPATPTPTITATPTLTPTQVPTPTITVTPSVSPLPSPSVFPPMESPPPSVEPPYPPPTIPETIAENIIEIGVGVGETVGVVTSILTEAEPIPIPEIVQESVRQVIQYIPGQERTVGVVSAVGTAVTATTSVLSLSAIFGGMFDFMNYGAYLWASFLEFLALRKRRLPWGTVYDAHTKRPIPLAKVQLLDAKNRVLETRITDEAGRYGFLVTPQDSESERTIQLEASKMGYVFPSNSITGFRDTILYDNVYIGGLRNVRVDEIANFNIPLDPLEKHAVAGVRKPPSLRFNAAIIAVAAVGFWCATVAAPIQYLAQPTLLNLIFAGTIVFLALIRLLGIRPRKFGIVSDYTQGLAMPFTLITLNDTFGRRVAFTVADEYGRYFLLAERGTYTLNAHTPAIITPGRMITNPIETSKGWIAKKITL